MIEKAPIGFLSPSHLSEADRALANKYAKNNDSVNTLEEKGYIYFFSLH